MHYFLILKALHSRSGVLDTNTLYSNDIDLMLRRYGIEAAARTIAKVPFSFAFPLHLWTFCLSFQEMNNVFGVYGIEVNPRHLSLVADYMTFTGEVQPFSRGAMADSPSPLQKMTFETTVSFMRDAVISGEYHNAYKSIIIF